MDFTKVKTGPANLTEADLDDHGALANGEVMVIEWDGTDGTCSFKFALYVGDDRKLYQPAGVCSSADVHIVADDDGTLRLARPSAG